MSMSVSGKSASSADDSTSQDYVVVGGVRCYLPEGTTEEEKENLLRYVSQKTGVPIKELTFSNFEACFGSGGSGIEWSSVHAGDYGGFSVGVEISSEDRSRGVTVSYAFDISEEVLLEVQSESSELYGGEMLTYPSEVGVYLTKVNEFDKEISLLTSEEDRRLAYALRFSAYSDVICKMYEANYASNPLLAIDESTLDPKIVAFCESVFGPDVEINQGHLNVLKTMGLVDGDVSSARDVSSWVLTDKGKEVAKGMEDAKNFVPDQDLFSLSAVDIQTMTASSRYFNQDGTGYTGKYNEALELESTDPDKGKKQGSISLEEDVASVVKRMDLGSSGTALPSGVTVSSEADAMMDSLFSDSDLPVSAMRERVDIAVSFGLVEVDENGQVVLTNKGQTYADDVSNAEAITASESTDGADAEKKSKFLGFMEDVSYPVAKMIMDSFGKHKTNDTYDAKYGNEDSDMYKFGQMTDEELEDFYKNHALNLTDKQKEEMKAARDAAREITTNEDYKGLLEEATNTYTWDDDHTFANEDAKTGIDEIDAYLLDNGRKPKVMGDVSLGLTGIYISSEALLEQYIASDEEIKKYKKDHNLS